MADKKYGVVYALVDPRHKDGDARCIRYIGYTFNIKKRLRKHLLDTRKNHRTSWLSNLRRDGLVPELIVIEDGLWTLDHAYECERYWIAQFKAWGFRLTNMTSGGDGVRDMSDEVKLKRSKSASIQMKELWKDPNYRERMQQVFTQSCRRPERKKQLIELLNRTRGTPELAAANAKRQKIAQRKPEVIAKRCATLAKRFESNEERLRIVKNITKGLPPKIGAEHPNAKSVICEQIGVTFGSVADAARWLAEGDGVFCPSGVVAACKGRFKSYKGFTWRYA